MKVTPALKSWLRDNKAMPADSSDEQYARAAADALSDGSLETSKFIELTADDDGKKADGLEFRIGQMVASAVKAALPQAEEKSAKISDSAPKMPSIHAAMAQSDDAVSTDPSDVKVITADKQYDTTRKGMCYRKDLYDGRKHPFAGQPVMVKNDIGCIRQMDEPSELDRAVTGAWFKCMAARSSKGVISVTDHDRELVQYAAHHMKWGGSITTGTTTVELDNEKLSDAMIKAVLDDNTSGGLEAAPIVFDDDLIRTPLQFGEFFPLVNLKTLTRGRRVEGVSAANVTVAASTEGTPITLFTTTSFISAFDTTIFVVAGAVEVGLDFMSDSPINWESVIQDQYGQQILAWLDEQICIGDGTTEPDGIISASGIVSVSADNTTVGPPTVGDYEELLFGVAKRFKQGTPSSRIVYGANETTYQRARSIAVGATDQRRVFGMTHEDYMLFGHPFKISTAMTNSQAFFGNMAHYRMYRRLGATVRMTTEGKELVRSNLMLISIRARFGGQIELGGYFANITNGQS